MEKEKLYRKVNKKSLSSLYDTIRGGEYRWHRQKHKRVDFENPVNFLSMRSGKYGRDFTPLYRFLTSKVGRDWDEVYSEAVSRIERVDRAKIFDLVGKRTDYPIVRLGEATHFYRLYVDENNILQFVDAEAWSLSKNRREKKRNNIITNS